MIRILIVEDNERMRSLIKSVVEDLVESVTECADGAKALAAYCECRPDLVLMDIRMPGLDGIAATTQIKDRFPEASVIMVTDYDDKQLRQAARKAGAYAYVLKEDLFDVRQLIDERVSQAL
jgi:two-component system response regulator DegU